MSGSAAATATSGLPAPNAVYSDRNRPYPMLVMQSRARRTVLSLAGAMLIAPVIGGWLIDHCPLHIRYFEAAEVVDPWKRADPPPNVLLLGSSRLRACVTNELLAQKSRQLFPNNAPIIFNASVGGGEPITLNLLTKRLLAERHIVPRLAVIEASPELLSRNNLYFKLIIGRQLTASDLPPYIHDFILFGATSRLLSSRVTPFYLHRSQFLQWMREIGCSSCGLTRSRAPVEKERKVQNRRPATPEDEQRNLAYYAHNLLHYEVTGATAAAFEHLIAKLRSEGCEIVLLEPPLTSRHRAIFTERTHHKFNDLMNRLTKQYNCQFVDFSDRFPDTFFYDSHHVNDMGRVTSTETFVKEVIAPAWRRISASQSSSTAEQPPPDSSAPFTGRSRRH